MEGPQFATPTALLCTSAGFILHSKLVEWDDVDDELSQRDAVIRSTVRRHWLNATIVWKCSYTDGNIPHCHQLVFHLSLLHTWCRKRRNEHKYKTRAPRVQLPPKGEGYTKTLFHEVFIPTCWCQPVFYSIMASACCSIIVTL